MSKSNRSKPSAGKLISGTHGVIWINGSKCYEVSKFEAKLSADREEVQFAGEMVKDSKLMALSGTWSATIKKYTLMQKLLLRSSCTERMCVLRS